MGSVMGECFEIPRLAGGHGEKRMKMWGQDNAVCHLHTCIYHIMRIEPDRIVKTKVEWISNLKSFNEV